MKKKEVIEGLKNFIKDNYLLPDIYNKIIRIGKNHITINPPSGIVWLKIKYEDIMNISVMIGIDIGEPVILLTNPNWKVIIYIAVPIIEMETEKGNIEIYNNQKII
jgi:hypothetical protein